MAADNPNQALIDQAAASKAVADAQAAAANAQKAQYEAEAAAAKAKYGDIPTSGYSGTATVGTGAGAAEATLLGARSLQSIATLIAKQVEKALAKPADKPKPVVLMFSSANVPDFQALTAFKAQTTFLRNTYTIAEQQAKPEEATVKESVVALGLGLDAISKLLSFAKTDYTFAALETTGTDAMLLNAVARELSGVVALQMPTVYSANIDSPLNKVFDDATKNFTLGVNARKNQRDYEASQKKAEEVLAADPKDDAKKAAVEKFKQGAAIWKTVGDTLDAWSKQATTSDDKGNVPLALVIRQAAVKQKLDEGGSMLVVQVYKTAGTSYTKKNLWASLGTNPFFVMGGAVAGYTLLDGKDGHVLASALLPWHGGYLPVDEVQAHVNDAQK